MSERRADIGKGSTSRESKPEVNDTLTTVNLLRGIRRNNDKCGEGWRKDIARMGICRDRPKATKAKSTNPRDRTWSGA